jgi:hypothetical protein
MLQFGHQSRTRQKKLCRARLRVLLKTVQRFFAKQVRVSLTCFGKFDDLVINISKGGANQLICYPHNAHGLGIE